LQCAWCFLLVELIIDDDDDDDNTRNELFGFQAEAPACTFRLSSTCLLCGEWLGSGWCVIVHLHRAWCITKTRSWFFTVSYIKCPTVATDASFRDVRFGLNCRGIIHLMIFVIVVVVDLTVCLCTPPISPMLVTFISFWLFVAVRLKICEGTIIMRECRKISGGHSLKSKS